MVVPDGGVCSCHFKKNDHEIIFWDTTFSLWDFAETTRKIIHLAPDLLCVNTVYIWEHTPALFDFFTNLKERGFTGHINLFGFFPTLAWKAILEADTAVDSIAVGEFEDTLTALAEQLCAGTELNTVAGLALRTPDGASFHKERPPEKRIDRFPTPMRACSPGATISILASRGCYNHCRFCPIPSFYNKGPEWNGREPKDILTEINELVEQGYTKFYFADPNFIGPGESGRERTLEIIKLIRPLKITFGMETRPNDLTSRILAELQTSRLQGIMSRYQFVDQL